MLILQSEVKLAKIFSILKLVGLASFPSNSRGCSLWYGQLRTGGTWANIAMYALHQQGKSFHRDRPPTELPSQLEPRLHLTSIKASNSAASVDAKCALRRPVQQGLHLLRRKLRLWDDRRQDCKIRCLWWAAHLAHSFQQSGTSVVRNISAKTCSTDSQPI